MKRSDMKLAPQALVPRGLVPQASSPASSGGVSPPGPTRGETPRELAGETPAVPARPRRYSGGSSAGSSPIISTLPVKSFSSRKKGR